MQRATVREVRHSVIVRSPAHYAGMRIRIAPRRDSRHMTQRKFAVIRRLIGR